MSWLHHLKNYTEKVLNDLILQYFLTFATLLTESLLDTGREKIEYSKEENVYLVLESDGTYVDDDEFLRWFPDNTAFLLLRAGESWKLPVLHSCCVPQDQSCDGSGSLKSFPLPRVVCDALSTLNINHDLPFWKIVDNQDKITLVLHWKQQRNNRVPQYMKPNHSPEFGNARFDYNKASNFTAYPWAGIEKNPKEIVAEVNNKETIDSQQSVKKATANTGTVFKSTFRDCSTKTDSHSHLQAHEPHGSVHISSGSTNEPHSSRSNFSSAFQHGLNKCEFHCGSLHDRGRPIQSAECNRHRSHSMSKVLKSSHVHFCEDRTEAASSNHEIDSRSSLPSCTSNLENAVPVMGYATNAIDDEFESETNVTTEKILLLTDQLGNERHKHLTIFDLGVILERLKTKIIDVQRLEREREDLRCFRWIINATIRGEILRDLGVLYNGNYYSISESPLISDPFRALCDEEDDRQDST